MSGEYSHPTATDLLTIVMSDLKDTTPPILGVLGLEYVGYEPCAMSSSHRPRLPRPHRRLDQPTIKTTVCGVCVTLIDMASLPCGSRRLPYLLQKVTRCRFPVDD